MDRATLISVLGQFEEADAIAEILHDVLPLRESLPGKRRLERGMVSVSGFAVYVDVGFYEDGRPGEVFLKASKYGTNVRDMFDALAIVISVSMQHGVPLSAFPIRGHGNDLTGEGNHLIDAIIAKVEELCTPNTSSPASPTSTESTTPPSDTAPPSGS